MYSNVWNEAGEGISDLSFVTDGQFFLFFYFIPHLHHYERK